MIRNASTIIQGAVNTVAHTDYEGYAVELDANRLPTLVASATAIPDAVILQGRAIGSFNDLQLFTSDKVIDVRLGGTGTAQSEGVLTSDGRFQDDPGTGSRVICCKFLKSGVAGDLVPAVLFRPLAAS